MSALEKPAKRGRKPRKPLPRATQRIAVRRPLGTVRKEAKAENEIDPDTWTAVVRFYGGKCAYCLCAPYEQQDHIKPIAHGGKNLIQNTATICARCNANKGTRHWKPKFKHPYTQEPR